MRFVMPNSSVTALLCICSSVFIAEFVLLLALASAKIIIVDLYIKLADLYIKYVIEVLHCD